RVSPKRPAVPATGAANARRGRLSSTPAAHSVEPHENLAPDAGGPRSGPRFGPRRAAHSVRMTKPTRPDRRRRTGETPPTARALSLQLRLVEDLEDVLSSLTMPADSDARSGTGGFRWLGEVSRHRAPYSRAASTSSRSRSG